ncbi:protein tyrosine phosphatase type IVA 3 [Trichinella spiralis]|uniref:protein tyrosine phosphatase type IVA 3 n=1 Tax=Trichinella spiralis TaxID=6334 RepID=UPI0001EFBD0B|nr:protein tyrosine phosphatase type IVA 3 [Trichinella spiralis]
MARSSILSNSNHRATPPNNYYKPAPAEISYGHMRFLITDRPSDATMGQFLENLPRSSDSLFNMVALLAAPVFCFFYQFFKLLLFQLCNVGWSGLIFRRLASIDLQCCHNLHTTTLYSTFRSIIVCHHRHSLPPIVELKRHQVHIVVRVCEPTYSVEELKQHGIEVIDWEFPDGMSPPKEIRDRWIELLKERFVAEPGTCIAVHCVAGLGRAPVLVALALMEAGLQFEDAVDLIRQNRRGAINQKQLYYLEKYKSSGELKRFRNGKRERECVIM